MSSSFGNNTNKDTSDCHHDNPAHRLGKRTPMNHRCDDNDTKRKQATPRLYFGQKIQFEHVESNDLYVTGFVTSRWCIGKPNRDPVEIMNACTMCSKSLVAEPIAASASVEEMPAESLEKLRHVQKAYMLSLESLPSLHIEEDYPEFMAVSLRREESLQMRRERVKEVFCESCFVEALEGQKGFGFKEVFECGRCSNSFGTFFGSRLRYGEVMYTVYHIGSNPVCPKRLVAEDQQ